MYILAPPQSLWSSSSELSETLPPRLESFVRPLTHNFDVVHFSSVDRRMCGGHGKKNHKAHCSYQYLAVFLEQTLLGIVQAFNFQSSSKFILRVFVVFSLLLWRNRFWGQVGLLLNHLECNPLQYSCLENSMDRGAWRATVHGVTNSRIWLSN